jgi:short-subunit dehydrogenase
MYALITGATSGIGLEIANIFAKQKINLVLVARSKDKLEKIKDNFEDLFKIKVHTIEKDLSQNFAALTVWDEITRNEIQIDYLVNNAGVGHWGKFVETYKDITESMIDLNIKSLTQLTKFALEEMTKRGSGKILNVSSVVASQPGPEMAVYFASKAFVLNFSAAVNYELKGTGVTVTALCPGATKTGFEEHSKMNGSKMFHSFLAANPADVAAYGVRAMLKGKAVAIPGFINKLFYLSGRFFPREIVMKVTEMLMSPKK